MNDMNADDEIEEVTPDDDLLEVFPWLSNADLATLAKKPWLQLFLEFDDVNLTAAKIRHRAAIKEARVELRKRGVEPHRRMMAGKNLETTAFVDPLTEGG